MSYNSNHSLFSYAALFPELMCLHSSRLFQALPGSSLISLHFMCYPGYLSQAVCLVSLLSLLVSISVSFYLSPHFWTFNPLSFDINHNHLPVFHLQKQEEERLPFAPVLIPLHGPLVQPLTVMYPFSSSQNLITIFMPAYTPCAVSVTFIFVSEGHMGLETHLIFPTELLV